MTIYTDSVLSCRTDAYAPSVLGHFSNAAVAVDGTPCAQIAKYLLYITSTAQVQVPVFVCHFSSQFTLKCRLRSPVLTQSKT